MPPQQTALIAAMIQRPSQYLIRIAIFLVAMLALAAFLSRTLLEIFLSNPALNGLILGVLLIGLGFAIREIWKLTPEVDWLDRVQRGDTRSYGRDPVLLAAMARLVSGRRTRLRLSPSAMRSLLDGVAARLHESRELSRYAIGLLVFLGLLGTFWGLLKTIGGISHVVSGLEVGQGDIGSVFSELKAGLQTPLAGMGTAFSSSLFGLASSLVLSFVDLQAGQAQNRFYTELEDWLAENTEVGDGAGAAVDADGVPTAYLAALVEQNTENLDRLRQIVASNEDERRRTNEVLGDLGYRLNALADLMKAEHQLLARMTELQTTLSPMMSSLHQAIADGRLGVDAGTQQHVRNLDGHLARMMDENVQGRIELIDELRAEIRLLAKTIAASHAEQHTTQTDPHTAAAPAKPGYLNLSSEHSDRPDQRHERDD